MFASTMPELLRLSHMFLPVVAGAAENSFVQNLPHVWCLGGHATLLAATATRQHAAVRRLNTAVALATGRACYAVPAALCLLLSHSGICSELGAGEANLVA